MSESTVQVPASLIERVPHSIDCDYYCTRKADQPLPCSCARAELVALLSQPTPTAEHADDCGYLEEDVVEPHGSRISPNAHCTCAPPRIEGMAPGTTFVATAPGWNPQVFRVSERRHIERAVWRTTGWATYDNDLDPSTIRDVTPPEDAA